MKSGNSLQSNFHMASHVDDATVSIFIFVIHQDGKKISMKFIANCVKLIWSVQE